MKTRTIIFGILLLGITLLQATTRIVSQDETGSYSVIQEAIEASENGDSILVYPGTYYETIDYLGKSLSLYSLYAITGDTTVITSTILDGSNEDAVVTIINCNQSAIKGFTIQNGFGHIDPNFIVENYRNGGGIFANDSNLIISHCIVQHNTASHAGGIELIRGNYILSGNIITHNAAYVVGGGIIVGYDGDLISTYYFDNQDKNSIYLNTSPISNDILLVLSTGITLPLKKVTSTLLDYYYIGTYYEIPIDITYEETAITEVHSDLYVSNEGNDTNDGLTINSPLKTISYAMEIVASDSTNIHTIHVADGTYSATNGEFFPIHVKPYVKVIGQSMENTIVDTEHKNFSFNGPGDIRYHHRKGDIAIENFKFINSMGKPFIAIDSQVGIGLVEKGSFKNFIIDNTVSEPYYSVQAGEIASDYFELENVSMKTNYQDLSSEELLRAFDVNNSAIVRMNRLRTDKFGQGLLLEAQAKLNYDIVISNISSQNCINMWFWPDEYVGSALDIWGYQGDAEGTRKAKVVNCTFTHSTNRYGAVVVHGSIDAAFYNCLIYDNHPIEIVMDGRDYPGKALWDHCLIEWGAQALRTYGTWDLLYRNLLDSNPRLLNTGEYPEALSSSSPCINAGTIDIPGYDFPATDLAGNPRFHDGQIDIGAFEYQGTAVEEEENMLTNTTELSVYPNPLRLNNKRDLMCKIDLSLSRSGTYQLSIYNSKGQLVKKLMDVKSEPGRFSTSWDGKDMNNSIVSTGIYFVKLTSPEETKTCKMTIVK